MAGRLKIPLHLAAVVLLAGCPDANEPPAPDLAMSQPESSLCPDTFDCDNDAARALNCTDAATTTTVISIVSDAGACYTPI